MIEADFRDIGRIDYLKAWKYQEKVFNEVIENKNMNTGQPKNFLIFCEHDPVFTVGKSGKENNLLVNEDYLKQQGVGFYKTDRGGDITFHGPGQIVGYPVFDLGLMKIGVKDYVHLIEESVIRTLQDYNIKTERLAHSTGVWIDTDNHLKTRKICAIGVKVSRFVTMHGFAFNINTDLNYFSMIHPCGFVDKGVTSLEKELGKKIEINEVKKVLLKKISELFKIKINYS